MADHFGFATNWRRSGSDNGKRCSLCGSGFSRSHWHASGCMDFACHAALMGLTLSRQRFKECREMGSSRHWTREKQALECLHADDRGRMSHHGS